MEQIQRKRVSKVRMYTRLNKAYYMGQSVTHMAENDTLIITLF